MILWFQVAVGDSPVFHCAQRRWKLCCDTARLGPGLCHCHPEMFHLDHVKLHRRLMSTLRHGSGSGRLLVRATKSTLKFTFIDRQMETGPTSQQIHQDFRRGREAWRNLCSPGSTQCWPSRGGMRVEPCLLLSDLLGVTSRRGRAAALLSRSPAQREGMGLWWVFFKYLFQLYGIQCAPLATGLEAACDQPCSGKCPPPFKTHPSCPTGVLRLLLVSIL